MLQSFSFPKTRQENLMKSVKCLQPRRPGDVASCYASSTLAERELGFKAEKSLTDMCKFATSITTLHEISFPLDLKSTFTFAGRMELYS